MSPRRPHNVHELPEWQCRYRGGECMNERATKIDGSPHHLCQEHRLRANRNQRISQTRRREQRRNGPAPQATPAGRRRPAHQGNEPAPQPTPAGRRRQVRCDHQLRRLNYFEWLQILDSVEWSERLVDPASEHVIASASTSVSAAAAAENDLFAPLVTQLHETPLDQDAFFSETIYYLIGSDASFRRSLLSEPSDDPITDINSDSSQYA